MEGVDDISDITKTEPEDEEDDDMLDTMARFVEGADSEIIKDHSGIIEDDEKIMRIKA